MDEESALLLRAARGDRGALEAFRERRAAEALRLAFLLTGDLGRAEEALQEAWVAALSSLAAFDPAKGTGRGWFLGILRHKARRIRAGRRPLSLEALDGLQAAAMSPEETASRREERAALLAALEALPEDQREAVAGRWILGWHDAELAEALGVGAETARQRAHRGLLALRKALREKD